MIRRIPLCLALLTVASAGCMPLDEGPPPNYATPDEPAPPEPQTATPAPNPDDGKYASGEVAVGEDKDAYDDNDPAALTDFRAALDPYGRWVDDPKYGTIWVPSTTSVGEKFVPYETAGHWTYDDDWVWVSDYPWGWAPFHYGRWIYVEGSGWAWVPGRVYRGAWVEWGVDPAYAYVGWYPMAPGFFWFGGAAMAYGWYYAPAWVYCPRAYVFAPNVGARVLAGPAVGPVASRVTGYVGAAPGVGPSPTRLGYAAASIPRPSGAGAASIAQARQFATPSTAVAAGAHAPTPVASTAAAASASAATRGSLTSGVAGAHATATGAQPASSGGKKGEPEASPSPRKKASGFGGYHGTPSSSYHGAPAGGGAHPSGGGHGGGHR